MLYRIGIVANKQCANGDANSLSSRPQYCTKRRTKNSRRSSDAARTILVQAIQQRRSTGKENSHTPPGENGPTCEGTGDSAPGTPHTPLSCFERHRMLRQKKKNIFVFPVAHLRKGPNNDDCASGVCDWIAGRAALTRGRFFPSCHPRRQTIRRNSRKMRNRAVHGKLFV